MKQFVWGLGIMFIITLSGCLVSMEETLHAPPLEDMSAWSQSVEAQEGVVVLGSDITRAAAVNVQRKMIALNANTTVERIVMVINSNGGDTSALRSIYNAIRFSNKPVDTVNAGNCYSAACAIFAGATGKRYAFPNTHFMVHKPQAVGGGDRRYRELIDFETEFFESVLKQSGLPQDWFPLSSKVHYFTAQEARQYEFLDAIVTELP